jgi:hypothetical protein
VSSILLFVGGVWLEDGFECVEALLPVALVEAQPGSRGSEGRGLQPAHVAAAVDRPYDEACPLEHLDVLRRGRQRNRQRRRELADRQLALGEPSE